MKYHELLDLRRDLYNLVEIRKKLGDFDTNAPAIRIALESCLALTQHIIDSTKKK